MLVVIARHDDHARPLCLLPQPLVLLEARLRREPVGLFPPGQRAARRLRFQLALAGRAPGGPRLAPRALEILHVHVADVHDAPHLPAVFFLYHLRPSIRSLSAHPAA